jgi:V/A-type H+-transporting ATPase subunit I
VLKPVKMKKFSIKVSKDCETQILEEIGKLGVIQLTSERAATGEEPENIEIYNNFMKMCDRSAALMNNLQTAKDRFLQVLPGQINKPSLPPILPVKSIRATQEEITRYTNTYEGKLDELAHRIDSLQKDADDLSTAKDHLLLLKDIVIDLASLGDHKFIFTKVGFINNTFIPKLDEYLKDFKAVYKTKVTSPRESSLIVAALSEYKLNVEKALALLNFSEFSFPSYLPSDPNVALGEVDRMVGNKLEEIAQLENLLKEIITDLEVYRGYVSFLNDTQPSLLKIKDFSIIQGWVPESGTKKLKNKVSQWTNKVQYLNIETPKEDEKIPTELRNKGILKNFELLTNIRGIPDYKDIDPTVIYAILFPIMYGMMFGDIGDGLIILIWGLLFYKRTKPFLGISRRAIHRLGVIMMIGGLSAIIFGALYGSVFLYEGIKPLLLRPTESFYTIVGISLLFGVVQIMLGMSLNIVNNLLVGDFKEVIFGGKGVFGLIYYIIGVVLAYRLILNGLQFSTFLLPENVFLTISILTMLGLIFFSPTIKGLVSHDSKIKEELIEGFGEFMETFFSTITNSISYIRLAAFAIAHGVLAGFAYSLGDSVGMLPSFIIVNIMVVLIDGFAAGIQSIRLIFYEFSTKFFKGGGIRFKPLKLLLE